MTTYRPLSPGSNISDRLISYSPLYRAIGLVLDFIHRLVCGRQKIPQCFGDWICLDQWLRLSLSNGPNWAGLSCPIHLRTETDPVSEMLWDFLSTTYKTMDKVQNKPNSSVQHTPSSESLADTYYSIIMFVCLFVVFLICESCCT
jgi:hypothetical protein